MNTQTIVRRSALAALLAVCAAGFTSCGSVPTREFRFEVRDLKNAPVEAWIDIEESRFARGGRVRIETDETGQAVLPLVFPGEETEEVGIRIEPKNLDYYVPARRALRLTDPPRQLVFLYDK
ncbi:MAG: hypothetical protein IPM29_17565 [Planctomycetes bacterium]|nr:hypothetical protein [Planctomycetota bacterium]